MRFFGRRRLLLIYLASVTLAFGVMLCGFVTPKRTAIAQKTSNQANAKEQAMTQHATGTFDVKLTPLDNGSADKSIGRMTIEKQWHGVLQGTSNGQMLTAGDVTKGSAGYVAIEKFTGTLNGGKGSFILQHSATMTHGTRELTITIVPDSGTEALQGISGKLTIKIENGKHLYDLEYRFSQ